MKKIPVFLSLFILSTAPANSQDQRVYDSFCLNLVKNENFWTKTVQETFGSQEGQAVLAAVCTYFTANPQSCASAIQGAGAIYGALHDQSGSDTHGYIKPRDNYEVCRAFVVDKDLSNTPDDFFSARVHAPVWGIPVRLVTYYNSWQVGTGKRSWIDTQIVLEQVPIGTASQYGCWKAGTLFVAVKGPNRYGSVEGERVHPDGLIDLPLSHGPPSQFCIDHQ